MSHFISYSSIDGLDYAFQLADSLTAGTPKVECWIDRRKLTTMEGDWPSQIVDAIRKCDSFIFIITRDSVHTSSVCKNELQEAIRFKKPIIPVRLHKDADLPFRINCRQYIDFTVDYDAGLAKLRKEVQWLGTPEGELQLLTNRLADAQRDLKRASECERNRIVQEIQDISDQILERIRVLNTSHEDWERSLAVRLKEQQAPPSPKQVTSTVRFINQAPMSAPPFFQDRESESRIITEYLKDESCRIITLIGRGGVGKTAVVCRLLKSLERGTFPDDLGEFRVGGIIYHSKFGIQTIGFANLFGDLCKLLPPDVAAKYDSIFQDGQRSVRDKMYSLLEEFRSDPVIVLLDNLENLIDPETLSITREELKDSLLAILEAPQHSIKVIITTRVPPRNDLFACHPERQGFPRLDGGLGSPYAENVLRALDKAGMCGLKEAPDSVLTSVCVSVRGFPRALEAVYGALAADRNTTLEELVSSITDVPSQHIVEIMVGEAFSRLDKNAQLVMQALAIYARPVPPVALDFLLQLLIPTPNTAPILKRLVNMHFVRREQDRYYLHPVDLAYALSLIPVEAEESSNSTSASFSQQRLRERASEYYAQIRRPREESKNLDDLEPQLSEFELRCAAEDYETAYYLLNDVDEDYLSLWGHAGLLVDMRKRLIDCLTDGDSICWNLVYLGGSYILLGQPRKTIEYCNLALQKNLILKDLRLESYTLNTLATAYCNLGQHLKAIELYERSLENLTGYSDLKNAAVVRSNLGTTFACLGLIAKSIDYLKQALETLDSIGDTRYKGMALGSLSFSLRMCGRLQEALSISESALKTAQDEKDRYGETNLLWNLSSIYLDMGDSEKGVEYLDRTIDIAHETSQIEYLAIGTIRRGLLKLFSGLPEGAREEFDHAAKNYDEPVNSEYKEDFRLARAMLEIREGRCDKARRILKPVLNTEYRICAPNILALDGIALLRTGEVEEARNRFTATIEYADNLLQQTPDFYLALEAKGVAACGLAMCTEEKKYQYLELADECYRKAREIVGTTGIVRRALFFFDECAKADTRGILSSIRCKVEG